MIGTCSNTWINTANATFKTPLSNKPLSLIRLINNPPPPSIKPPITLPHKTISTFFFQFHMGQFQYFLIKVLFSVYQS